MSKKYSILEYAGKGHELAIKHLRIALLTTLIVCGIALLAFVVKQGPRVWHDWQQARALSECATFEFPADTIIYADDQATVLAKARDPMYDLLVSPGAPGRLLRKPPDIWFRLAKYETPPPLITNMTVRLEPPTSILFMHKRVTRGGQARVVVLWFGVSSENKPKEEFAGFDYRYLLFEEGQTRYWPGVAISPRQETAFQPGELRISGGITDARDTSKFYVPWDWGGKHHVGEVELVEELDPDFGPDLRLKLTNMP